MGRYIKLLKQAQSRYVQGRTQGWRMVITATEASGMPKEIFVYQRKPGFGADAYTDVFTNVASPADIEEYPVGSPSDPNMPFFRLDYIDLVFRSQEIGEEAWEDLLVEVTGLVEALNFMDQLDDVKEVTIGTPPTPSSSSSSSSS